MVGSNSTEIFEGGWILEVVNGPEEDDGREAERPDQGDEVWWEEH